MWRWKNLIQIIETVENWCDINKISLNRKKSGILVVKGKTEKEEIKGIPIIQTYKYLGITLNKKLDIKERINNKLKEHENREYVMNCKHFSVKNILILHTYFQKSRMVYGLPCFIDQKSNIKNIEKFLMRTLKRMLKFTNYTNTERLKLSLGIPDIEVMLCERLLVLKEKYKKNI